MIQVATPAPLIQQYLEPVSVSPEHKRSEIFEKQLLTVPRGTTIPGNPMVTLKCPIFASIDWSGDGVVISSVLFDEDGYGGTYEVAWADLLSSLRDRYTSLAKREAVLSAADREVLTALRSSINF